MPKKHAYVPLSDQVRAIILGSLLGDGSLRIFPAYQNARFQMRHSETQAEYFQWKVVALREIAGLNSVCRQEPDGYSTQHMLRFVSKALPSLTEIYRLTHKKKSLCIRRKWLNQMLPLSLAVWWCDDGSLIGNSRKGVFCTDGFDRESVKILAQYLAGVWKVRSVVAPVERKRKEAQKEYWRLWIRSTDELKKFLRIILPYIPVASMLPKVLLLYKDSQLQQRWISEVFASSNFSRETIEEYVNVKKAKWKQFRE